MTATAYKSRRIALGHTQQTLADVLKLDRVTIARRETGTLPITAEARLSLMSLRSVKSNTTKTDTMKNQSNENQPCESACKANASKPRPNRKKKEGAK